MHSKCGCKWTTILLQLAWLGSRKAASSSPSWPRLVKSLSSSPLAIAWSIRTSQNVLPRSHADRGPTRCGLSWPPYSTKRAGKKSLTNLRTRPCSWLICALHRGRIQDKGPSRRWCCGRVWELCTDEKSVPQPPQCLLLRESAGS